MKCQQCEGSGIIYDDEVLSGKYDCDACQGVGIIASSERDFLALERWAEKNGWVKRNNG